MVATTSCQRKSSQTGSQTASHMGPCDRFGRPLTPSTSSQPRQVPPSPEQERPSSYWLEEKQPNRSPKNLPQGPLRPFRETSDSEYFIPAPVRPSEP